METLAKYNASTQNGEESIDEGTSKFQNYARFLFEETVSKLYFAVGEHMRVHDVCYQIMVAAHIMQILSLEIFYVPIGSSEKLDSSLREQLLVLNSKKTQEEWLRHVVTYPYNRKQKEELFQQAIELRKLLGFSELATKGLRPLPPKVLARDILLLKEGERIYGINYKYNVPLIHDKLFYLLSEEVKNRSMSTTVSARHLLLHIQKMNETKSLLDVQGQLMHAWKCFIEVTALRQPLHSIFAPKMQTSLFLVVKLAEIIQQEHREGKAVNQRLEQMSQLLAFILRNHLSREASAQDNKGKEKDGKFRTLEVRIFLFSCLTKNLSLIF